jgi:hypothetical protein
MTSSNMNTRLEAKINHLFSTLSKVFGEEMNFARIKFFGLFICALCKVQTVCFEKLAVSFGSSLPGYNALRLSTCLIKNLLPVWYSRYCYINRLITRQWTGLTGSLERQTLMFWFLPSFIRALLFPSCSR